MKSKLVLIGALMMLLTLSLAAGVSANGGSFERTYTLDADFDEGALINVNHDAPNNDQLQLDSAPTPFEFIWVAASGRGTIVKIDTVSGAILGEYLAAPDGRGLNPSRTTVDGNGNVWSANRAEDDGNSGSVVKIGLLENGQCVDKDGNGTIDTSGALGDIKPWKNDGGADDNGGVSTAEDECILLYERLPNAPSARHVSVDANNDVWVGGYPYLPTTFLHLDGSTGAPLGSFDAAAVGCGGYGGLVDGNGVLWSASISQNKLLRYDVGAAAGTCIPVTTSYGLGIDTGGNIWNAMWNANTITKFDWAGTQAAGFPKPSGGSGSRGVVITPIDDDVWIANSHSNTVTRLDNNGVFKATIPVGNHPTGVAVDAAGKVWVTNLNSDDVMRIDPASDAVDLTVSLGAGAAPYNYSDMTGSTLIAPPNEGTWSVVADSAIVAAEWQVVSWTADEPGDSSIVVNVASSADGITFGPEELVSNGGNPTVDGQYLKISVSFTRGTGGESPILYDLKVSTNRPPVCDEAAPSSDILWQPNHRFYAIDVLNVTDPDGHDVTITIDAIVQDEEVDTYGDGRFTPDGDGVGTSTAHVRAERAGSRRVPGDGRIYIISFTADDGHGLTCSSTVQVGVPHDRRRNSVPQDSGPPYYDSTALVP